MVQTEELLTKEDEEGGTHYLPEEKGGDGFLTQPIIDTAVAFANPLAERRRQTEGNLLQGIEA